MKKLNVMIVSPPGTWQRVLQKNLEAYPFVEVGKVVSGSLSASQLAKKTPPDLMVIDSSIPFDDAVALVQNVRRETPATKLIVITDTTQQRRRIIPAGADYTIPSYNFESQIGTVLTHLHTTLSESIEDSETTFEDAGFRKTN